MAKPKIPAKLYVTAKHEFYDRNNPPAVLPPPLGFLNAYEPGKTSFDKKKATQEEWAYGGWNYNSYNNWNIKHFKLELHGPEYWIVGDRYGEWQNGNRVIIPFAELVDPQPGIWDNHPLPGFKILKSVSRSSTSNKLWRILDPRGVQFEISTLCMETIIENSAIRQGGVIDKDCYWVSNKNLIVAP